MIVGAQKAGTTALAHFLSQHPQIYMTEKKEVHLFDDPDYSDKWNDSYIATYYSKYLQNYNDEKVIGEATPIYMYLEEIAPELKRYNPDLKIIVLLRNPVERAVSHYLMEKHRGNDSVSMNLAFLLELFRISFKKINNVRKFQSLRIHSYISRGFYEKQLKNLRTYFPDDQILVIENSELLNSHYQILNNVFLFLCLDNSYIPPPEILFPGNHTENIGKFSYMLLNLLFKYKNRNLRKLLKEMGYKPNWQWL